MRSLWGSVLAVFCVCAGCSWALPVYEGQIKASCGYQSCPVGVSGKLNVHLIAHTHDDVGWLKTVDQYYYGSSNNIQKAGVQYIIDSVINELLLDSSKRFIYVETSFLWKWWQEQSETKRSQVRGLVDSGQLEIIGGAWSMNDEAVTHYQSTIDQFTWGFRVLNDTLGSCATPRIGWQIDPFGHSREMASLLAQLGMDGLFFGRLDQQDKVTRIKNKTMEMIWRGSPENLGSSSDLFTHAMFNFYFSPPGFCFDIMCDDEPMIDNVQSVEYNIPKRMEEFTKFLRDQAAGYKTNNILVTMGGDFHYQDAGVWFKNMDKLIKHTNDLHGSEINVFYSTPSCYLKAVNEAQQTWPTKEDDFFPYGSEDHAYWTGYFTSKPTIKFYERFGNNFLQVSKQLTALAGMSLQETEGVTALREAMGIMQHHDAITGTMKDHVAHDYSRILTEAMHGAGDNAKTAVNTLMNKEGKTIPVTSCLLLNTSACLESETLDTFVVTLYNPVSRPVSKYVRLPVSNASYTVADSNGTVLPTQIVPLPSWVTSLPGRESIATNELVFLATDLPPLGYRSYFITTDEDNMINGNDLKPVTKAERISNEHVTVNVDADGSMLSVSMNNVEMSMKQKFGYYEGFFQSGERPSGAYIFRPRGADISTLDIDQAWTIRGEHVEEVHQLFKGGWAAQVIRVYKEENHVEFEWHVGPIPSNDQVGKEVVSRFETDLATATAFYTDSNGREMLKRMRNFRPSWNFTVTEPIASNFYPVTSRIVLKDEVKGQQAAILVDRAQSGSSLKDGQIDLMIHRRLLHDDGYGVDEPLNEEAFGTGLVARGRHYLTVGATSTASPTPAATERLLAQRKLLQPWIFLSPAKGMTLEQWLATNNMEYYGLKESLPENVQLLTLESWKDERVLVRLEHILEKGEDPEMSKQAVVNLQDMFSKFTVVSAEEMTLGGNLLLQDKKRMSWTTEDGEKTMDPLPKPLDVTAVTLDPMQIRTFIVRISPQ